MFTPKDLQEISFEKAFFGGYDMQMVDEFLEPLTQDYITLYKENSVLKSKMKILVEKLEEYRAKESSLQKALMSAQASANEIVAEAQRKASRIMNEAENTAESRKQEQNGAMEALDVEFAKEQKRVDEAKAIAQKFISVVEGEVYRHLKALGRLKELSEDAKPEEKPAPVQEEAPAEVADMDSELAAIIGNAVQEISAETPASVN